MKKTNSGETSKPTEENPKVQVEGKEEEMRDQVREILSLKDLAILEIKKKGINYRGVREKLPKELVQILESKFSFYEREARKSTLRHKFAPLKTYLSSTTLVVVPPNLQDQWISEINKHMQDGFLRVFIDDLRNELPPPKVLASHDIVLTTLSRLSKETVRRLTVNNVNRYGVNKEEEQLSVFAHIQFYRVIIDEGHVVSKSKTSRVESLSLIKAGQQNRRSSFFFF